jgi:hypothetical protein
VTQFAANPNVGAVIVESRGTCAEAPADFLGKPEIPATSFSPLSQVVSGGDDRKYMLKAGATAADGANALVEKSARNGFLGNTARPTTDAYGRDGKAEMAQATGRIEGVEIADAIPGVVDDAIATTPARAACTQWLGEHSSAYGSHQGSVSFAADSVRVIAGSVIRKKSANRSDLRSHLEIYQADGLTGPLRMSPNNHSTLMPQELAIPQLPNGRWNLSC